MPSNWRPACSRILTIRNPVLRDEAATHVLARVTDLGIANWQEEASRRGAKLANVAYSRCGIFGCRGRKEPAPGLPRVGTHWFPG